MAQVDGQQNLSTAASGYGVTPAMHLNLVLDTKVNQTLPPTDNLILDGNFEAASLGSWQGLGDPAPATTNTAAHTGNYAVSLGSDNAGPMVLESASTGYYPIIPVDHNQTSNSLYGISRSLHIPSDMHQPTLSFWFLSPRVGSPENRVYATVTHDLDTTEVISTTPTAGDWGHAWADMSPWAGQDVTITIGYRLSTGSPLVPLVIDEIVLGSWLTPVITEITPSPIASGAPIDIIITGQNFFSTPQVHIDGHPVPDVHWQDEHTLQVQLPGGLPPGTYEIRVTNPGGQVGVAPGGLKIGQQIYLPFVY